MSLHLDWCSYEAAKFAVKRWHYSKAMPSGKLVKIGVWEDGQFIGCVLFGRGATQSIGVPFGLQQVEICELVRVALRAHQDPVSRIISVAIKMLRRQSPGLKLIVSYADPKESHHGGIYQAGNWMYLGQGQASPYFRLRGKIYHPRSVHSRYGSGSQKLSWLRANIDPEACYVPMPAKHKYVYPLTKQIREQLAVQIQPYPKRACAGSVEGDASTIQVEEGGSIPTPAL